MIKRITITIAAAALFVVPAQSASAAIDVERPNAQEMEHGIAQPSYGGTTTPPSSETIEPETTESIPTPAEQGISTSPGVAPEVTEPPADDFEPYQAAGDEKDEEEDDGPSCGELADQKDEALALGRAAFKIGTALGGFGGLAFEIEDVYNGDVAQIEREMSEQGCDDEKAWIE
jgi:hypothetical protein